MQLIKSDLLFGRSERFCKIVAQGASDSRNFNYSQHTATRWAVSNERQLGGVEKKTPTNHPHPVGGGLLKIRRCVKRNRLLMPGDFTANPMPRKRKPPATGALLAAGGKNRLSKKHTLR